MTTPSREEAPERVWMSRSLPAIAYTGAPHLREANAVEYLRADLANREPSEGDVERMSEAIAESIVRQFCGWHPQDPFSWEMLRQPDRDRIAKVALAALTARSQP